MKPYYDCDGITIYHADCRDVLPSLEPVDLVMTDPPYGILRQTRGTIGSGTIRNPATDWGDLSWDKSPISQF